MTTLLVIIIFAFLIFLSVIYFIGWQSSRDPNVLGGVILLWLAIIFFLLIIIFGPKNRAAASPAETKLVFQKTVCALRQHGA